jgi:hypothetical protein
LEGRASFGLQRKANSTSGLTTLRFSLKAADRNGASSLPLNILEPLWAGISEGDGAITPARPIVLPIQMLFDKNFR